MDNQLYVRKMAKLLYALDYKGRYCSVCNFDGFEEPWFMDLHHRDPDKKIFEVKNRIMGSDFLVIKEELDKCDLVCGRCHRKEHSYHLEYKKHEKDIMDKLKKIKEKNGDLHKYKKIDKEERLRINDLIKSEKKNKKQAALESGKTYNQVLYSSFLLDGRKVKKDIDFDLIKKLYDEKKSLREIGKIVGSSYMTIKDRLSRGGVNIERWWERKTINNEEIIKYYSEGLSMTDIKKITKIRLPKIRSILMENGIKIRQHYTKLESVSGKDLKKMKESGKTYRELSEAYGVSINSIVSKIKRMG